MGDPDAAEAPEGAPARSTRQGDLARTLPTRCDGDHRARVALAALDAALDEWFASTFHLALAIAEAQETRCWEECEDFTAQRDFGSLDLVTRSQGHDREPTVDWLATYCRFRGVDIGSSQAGRLAAAGRAHRLLELGISETPTGVSAPMPENESQLRPLTRALKATSEDDEATVAANVAGLWEYAVQRNDGDTAKAASDFPALARQSEYEPLKNAYRSLTKQERKDMEALTWRRGVERWEREFKRLYAMQPRGAKKMLAAIEEWTRHEEQHRDEATP